MMCKTQLRDEGGEPMELERMLDQTYFKNYMLTIKKITKTPAGGLTFRVTLDAATVSGEQPVSSASPAAGLDDERAKLIAKLVILHPPAKKVKTEE